MESTKTNWSTESVRLTWFYRSELPIDFDKWFAEATGTPPSLKQENNQDLSVQYFGEVNDSVVRLVTRSGRIDWHLTPKVQGAAFEKAPALGPLEKVARDFIESIVNVAPDVRGVIRVALGGVCIVDVHNRIEGYKKLSGLLPFALDAEGSRDFSYSINRPRGIEFNGNDLEINRITRWSVGVYAISENKVTVPAGKAIALNFQDFKPLRQYFMARLEMDFNSQADRELNASFGETKPLFLTLLEMEIESSNKGDIK